MLNYSSWYFNIHSIGEYPLKCVLRNYGREGYIVKDGADGHVNSIIIILNNRNYANRTSKEHFMVRILYTAVYTIML